MVDARRKVRHVISTRSPVGRSPGPTYGERMRRKGPEPARITTAARSHSQDIRGRQRRYLISMGIRTLCFVLTVVFVGHWYTWIFLAGAVFLPSVAVVLATAGAAPDPPTQDFAYRPDVRAISDRPAEHPGTP